VLTGQNKRLYVHLYLLEITVVNRIYVPILNKKMPKNRTKFTENNCPLICRRCRVIIKATPKTILAEEIMIFEKKSL